MLRNAATTIGEIYSVPILLNAIVCFTEILDLAYFQIVSELSVEVLMIVFFCVTYFVLKLVVILGSSVFAALKVSHFPNFARPVTWRGKNASGKMQLEFQLLVIPVKGKFSTNNAQY